MNLFALSRTSLYRGLLIQIEVLDVSEEVTITPVGVADIFFLLLIAFKAGLIGLVHVIYLNKCFSLAFKVINNRSTTFYYSFFNRSVI